LKIKVAAASVPELKNLEKLSSSIDVMLL